MTASPGVDFPGFGVGLAIIRDGRLLLYRRMRSPEAGHWNIVGGKVDVMEHSSAAALREAREETGLSLAEATFLCLSEQIFEHDRQHWISMIYVCRDAVGEPSIMEPDRLPECGWFALDALPTPLSRFAADAVRHLKV